MANNLIDVVKKKLETPGQLQLSASDRALLEQTCKGLEEIKQQRLSEAATLSELKELIQSNPEQFTEEMADNFSALRSSIDLISQENKTQNALTAKAINNVQQIANAALSLISSNEAEDNASEADSRTTKKISSLTALCWFSCLVSLGTMTLLILNILGII